MAGRLFAAAMGGFLVALLGSLLLVIAGAGFDPNPAGDGGVAIFVFWVIGGIIALTAKTAAKAWRRILLFSAVLSKLFVVAGFIYAITAGSGIGISSPAGPIVTAVGSGIIGVSFAAVGFVLGIILKAIALRIGRDKKDQAPEPGQTES
jgi:hypothetical protein